MVTNIFPYKELNHGLNWWLSGPKKVNNLFTFCERKYQINLRIKLALKSMHVENTINTNNEQMTEFTSLLLEGEKGKLLTPHNVTLNMISAASV